jgi:hypothetical protein
MEKSSLTQLIKNIFTPTGNTESDKNRAESYAKSVNMDQANTEMATKGPQAAAKAMVEKFTVDDKFDYAAMRGMYA